MTWRIQPEDDDPVMDAIVGWLDRLTVVLFLAMAVLAVLLAIYGGRA